MLFIILLLIIPVATIALALLLFLIKNIKAAYWLAIISVFLPIGYINRYFIGLPSAFKYLPQGLVLLCTISIFLNGIFNKKIAFPAKIVFYLSVLVLLSVVSLIYNHANVLPALYISIEILMYICFIIILNNKEYFLTTEQLLTLIIKIGLVNTAIVIFQRAVFIELLGMGAGDMITGPFSSDSQLIFFQLFCLIVVVINWFDNKPTLKRISNFKIVLLLMTSIAIANSKAALIFVFLIFGWAFLFVEKREFFHKFKVVFAIFILSTLALFVAQLFWNKNYNRNTGPQRDLITNLSNLDYISDYLFGSDEESGSDIEKGGVLKRGAAIEMGYTILLRSKPDLLLGKGPGATSDTKLSGAEGYINKKFEGMKIGRVSYSQVLVELGFGGIFLLFIYLIIIYTWKSSKDELEYVQIIRKITCLLLLFYFGYGNLFDDLGFLFIISTITMTSIRSHKQEKTGRLQYRIVQQSNLA